MPETDTFLNQLQGICQTYYDASWVLQGYRRPGTRFFGIGSGPKGDACHKQFAADVSALVSTMTTQPASDVEALEVLEFMILEPERKRDDQLVYWMLLAVHGSAAPLCRFLTPAAAGTLCDTYDRLYPRRMRSPVQKQLYTALRNRAEGR